MSYWGIAPTPPRAWELWAAMPARLDTARMQAVLGGAGRIFLATDDLTPLAAEGTPWGRVVVAPVRRFYGESAEDLGRSRVVPFLIRAEVHSPGGSYNPSIPLEAAHIEAFAQIHGWTPGAFTYARASMPAWRETPPQALPLWDDLGGMWFLSAEYRILISPIGE